MTSEELRARGRAGIMARLMSEDWDAMTRAARASSRSVSNLDRWVTKAREANPALSDEQAERLAGMMRREHYVRMGKLSAQARRAKAAQSASNSR